MTRKNIHIIKRTEIYQSLLKSVVDYRITMLIAPPGYGKTTLAKDIENNLEKNALYIKVKKHITTAQDILSILNEYAEKKNTLHVNGEPQDFNNKHELSENKVYASFIKNINKKYTLIIIDDYQNIDSPLLDEFILNAAQDDLLNTHFLLLSRTYPALPLEGLRIKKVAAVFGWDALRFSSRDTLDLFEKYGSRDEEAAAEVCELSEGWPAAVQLCLQHYLKHRETEPVKELEQLFTEIFLSEYTEEEQKLLLQLAVFDCNTPFEAVFLSGKKSAIHILRALHDRGAFISYCRETGMYTIHAYFRKFLIRALEEDALPICRTIDKAALYRTAGNCSLQRGESLKAMHFFLSAGGEEDLLSILEIFVETEDGVFIIDCHQEALDIINTIPWSIRNKCPIGYLGFIYRYMVWVDKEKAYAMLLEAEKRFAGEPSFSPELHTEIQGETHVLHALYNFSDIEEMLRHHEKAYALFKGGSRLLDSDIYWAFTCPHSAFLFLRESGDYTRLVDIVNNKFVYFQKTSGGSSEGAQDLLHAEFFLETGRFLQAAHLLMKAEYKAEKSNHRMTRLSAAFTRARLWIAQGYEQKAWEALESVTPLIVETENPFLLHALDLCRSYIAAVLDTPEKIPDWLRREEVPFAQTLFPTGIYSYAVQGKVLIVLKKWPQLEALADSALEKNIQFQYLFGHIHTRLFKAIALAHTRNTARAQKQLDIALRLALPDGIITTMAEYGKYLYPLLQRLHDFDDDKALTILGKATKKYLRYNTENAFKLTLREQRILEEVAAGRNNKEIAAELGIQAGSIANSLSRIYAKMNVTNRAAAVRRWMEEGRGDAGEHAE